MFNVFTLSVTHILQKLVEIVRSRNKKRRRQRVGATGDEFAVEIMDALRSTQAQDDNDL
jgi:hypothetical protein